MSKKRHSKKASSIESPFLQRNSLLSPLLEPSSTRGRSQARSESSLLLGTTGSEAEERSISRATTTTTMHRHRGGAHRGRRGGAEPFLYGGDDPTFAVSSSTFIPSLADRVPVPAGEQRWLRYDSRGNASYVDASDATKNKHALILSLELPARDLIMVDPVVPTPIPPAILIRKQALVVVMGALRMVIGADRVYLLSVPATTTTTPAAAATETSSTAPPPLLAPLGFSSSAAPSSTSTSASASASASTAVPLLPTANAASNTDASWKFPDIGGAFEVDLSRRLADAAAARDRREAALKAAAAARARAACSSYEGGDDDGEDGSGFDAGGVPRRRRRSKQQQQQSSLLDEIAALDEFDGADGNESGSGGSGDDDDESKRQRHHHEHREPLPYELCALEAALATTTSALRDDANAIAAATVPALERLGAESVTRKGLENVRAAKLAIKRCEARVEAVKRELSEIIDDDEDLRDCLLSRRRDERREVARAEVARAAAALAEEEEGRRGEEEGDEEAPPVAQTQQQQQPQQLRRRGSSLLGGTQRAGSSVAEELLLHRQEHRLAQVRERSDVLLVENMLESYYMQVGQILSRLAVLKERIDDTEDLVNIELDAKRNSIFLVNLLVTLLTAALAVVSAVAGVLGMNLKPLPIENSAMPFILITSFAVIAGALVFCGTLYFARVKGLLFIPKAPKSM